MRLLPRIAVVGVLLLVAACGSSGTSAHRPNPGGYPHTGGPSANAGSAARGTVRVRLSPATGPRPREGYRPWASLSGAGHTWRPTRLAAQAASFSAPPGRYTLRVGIRLCNASCQRLDPPSATCRGPVKVRSTGTVARAVRLSVTGHCRIVSLH